MSRHPRTPRALGALILACVLILAVPGSASAQRGGFVIGLGIGGGLTSLGGGGGDRLNELGISTDFKIGYAPSPQTAIYWSAKSSFFTLMTGFGGDSDLNYVGVGGLGVTRFLSEDSPVAYVDGSVGVGNWGSIDDSGSTSQMQGFGITGGTGIELSQTTFVDFDVLIVRPGEGVDIWGLKVSFNWFSN